MRQTEMTDEPINHTMVWATFTGIEQSEIKTIKLFYKNYPDFADLPSVARSRFTKQEHEAWWKWYNENNNNS